MNQSFARWPRGDGGEDEEPRLTPCPPTWVARHDLAALRAMRDVEPDEAPASFNASAAGRLNRVDLSYADLGIVTGTTTFSANDKTGGTLDYTNSLGSYLHGTVTPGTVVKNGNTVTFRGVITDASAVYNGGSGHFVGVVKDVSTSGANGDQIAVFVNEEPLPTIHADVTSGNLTVF